MTVLAPDRSASQRMDALALANEVRFARAAMKQRMTLEWALELLADPPGWLGSMKVELFLHSVPKIGKAKAARVLMRCRIGNSKTVGGLTARQRLELIDAL